MLVVAQAAQPDPHFGFTVLLDGCLEEVLEASDGGAVLGAAVLLHDVALEVLLRKSLPSTLVEYFEFFI